MRHASQDTNRRDRAEDQILVATERLLNGGTAFTDLGVQKIAETARVARSSFYVIFPDKTALAPEPRSHPDQVTHGRLQNACSPTRTIAC